MPRVTWTQNNFNAGEWSPLAYGRSDIAKYKNALATCLNYVPTAQGGLTRRPGTQYIANTKGNAAVRLVPFEFSITQAYIVEFGAGYARFYTNDGQLLTGTPETYVASTVVTISIAAPGVVSWNGHGMTNGTPVSFATTGALPTGITAGTTYYVLNAATNTFQLAAVAGGAAITTSGTQSGVHTASRVYSAGALVQLGGTKYYCIATAVNQTPPNATYWYALTGAVYEIPMPYGASDLDGLSFTQSADVLYIAHPNYKPRKLQRNGALNWALSIINFLDGPYLIVNTSATTLTSAAASGATTLTASTALFTANDVGRSVRLKSGATWGWGRITAYTSPTVVSVTWVTAVGTTAVTLWRLGVWWGVEGSSATASYPRAACFNQDRLMWAGSINYPNRLDGSNTSDYENYAPSGLDGVVVDSNALSFSLNSTKVNVVNWLLSDEWGMLAGTASGEWVVAASTQQNAMTPTNITAKMTTAYGSTNVMPVKMGKSTLFVQRTKRKLREMNYQFTLGTFQAPDISLIGEHLTKSGLKQMAGAMAPQAVVWIVRNDGAFVGLSYDKDQDVTGWHQHQLGGYSDEAKTLPPLVESVAVIPSPETDRDQVWVSVKRYIDGGVVRTVELMTKYWEDGDTLAHAFFVDCGATYDSTPTTTVSGLTWLKGQTVSVLADGAVHPDCVVDSAGAITLNRSASTIQIGLGYNSDGKTMRIEAGGADGPAQGKLKRIHRAIFRFFQSVGLSVQSTGGAAYPEPFRTSADRMDNPVALYTGDKRWAWDGSYELEGQVFWRQDQPLPSNVLMVAAQLETQDGG